MGDGMRSLVVFLAVFGLVILPAVVTALKGRYGLLLVGFLVPGIFVWVIGALRLARPSSFWARRFYSADKRARSDARYPQST